MHHSINGAEDGPGDGDGVKHGGDDVIADPEMKGMLWVHQSLGGPVYLPVYQTNLISLTMHITKTLSSLVWYHGTNPRRCLGWKLNSSKIYL